MNDLVPGLDGATALVLGFIIVLGAVYVAEWRRDRAARRALMQEQAAAPDMTPRPLDWLADLDSFLDTPTEEETDGPISK